MSKMQELIERLKHGKHDQSTHGRRGRRGGGGGASASGGGGALTPGSPEALSKANEMMAESIRLASQSMNMSNDEGAKMRQRSQQLSDEAQRLRKIPTDAEQRREEARLLAQESARERRAARQNDRSEQNIAARQRAEREMANRDDEALIAQSKGEITRLQGMKKTAQDAIARGGETQPDGTFRQYSQGEMDYYKRQVATNDRFIESNQRTIQIANDRIRGRKNGEASASSGESSKPPKQTEYQKYAGKRDDKLQKAGLKPRSYVEAYQAAKNAEREINRVFHSGSGKAPLNTEVSTIQGSFDGDTPTGHYGFLNNKGIKWSGNRLRDMQKELRLNGISSQYIDDGQIMGLVVSNTYIWDK